MYLAAANCSPEVNGQQHRLWKVANPLYIDVHLVAHGQVRWFVGLSRIIGTCPYDSNYSTEMTNE